MVRSSHGVRLRITAAVLVFAAGLICAEGMATHPRWAAGVINAAHTLRLTAYSAVAFRRERLVPYPAVSVSDPNLPAGIHQILEPGRVGTMWQDGIALYLTPGPGARIDLFFWNSPAGIAAFGIRTLRVYVLDDPRLPPVPVPPDLRSSA